jgi:oxygen-independent coproporphyrinogen-3 oxidase
VENDLVEVTEDAIEVKPAGRFVIRNIAMVFDAYLRENSLSRPIFSRTV